MKKNMYIYLVSLYLLLATIHSVAIDQTPHIISFFIIPCVLNTGCAKKFPQDSLKDILGSHTEIAHEIIKRHSISPLVQGIYVNYLGYITYSDYNGQIRLPLKEDTDKLTVVVTDTIYPVIFQGKTVHHFEIPHENNAHFYTYSRLKDPDHKTWYWTVFKHNRPASSRIPLNALIIMAHPKDIEIMEGTFPALPGPHAMLPDIYVHSKMDTPFCILKFLKINRFFEPLTIKKEYKEQSYAEIVVS